MLATWVLAAVPMQAPPGPETLRKDIGALRKPKIAWRGIPWKTCLLDGLKASRDAKKPVVVWVFIDRPVDDEQC